MQRFSRLRHRLQSFTRSPQKPSPLAKVDLGGHKWTWTVQLCSKLVTIGALITAIALGGTSTVFSIKTKTVIGNAVDPDLQLAFLGLINKILDLLVTKALQITASVVLTLWMTQQPHSGVQLADFELGEELTKPWAALARFRERWSRRGWKNADWSRLLVALPVSICVILQGLAINTIGVPKERWSSEVPNVTVSHPIMQVQSLDWMNFWDAAWGAVGGGEVSWRVADSFIASSTHGAFRSFAWQLGWKPPGWQAFGDNGDEHLYPALYTRPNGSSCRGVAVNSSQAVDIFKWLQENGTGNARRAIGINADMKLTFPGTTVLCQPSSTLSSPDPSDRSVVVENPVSTSTPATLFSIRLLPDDSINFEGADCAVHFQRLLFPAHVWVIDESDAASASVNAYGKQYDIEPEMLPPTSVDTNMTDALAAQLRATMLRLETMTSGMNSTQWLLSVAREVRARRNEVQGAQYKNDIDALAPTVALLTNQLLASARWHTTFNEEVLIESSSVRWQLFGSGPRLAWAWSAAVILGILALVLSASVVLSIYRRIVPGEWLKAGGMLVAANSSPEIEGLKAALQKPRDELESMHFGVRQARQASLSNVAAIIAVEPPTGRHVKMNESYDW
ncbi:hypothetical protein Q7P37_000624 [Cladosporium fusiforme]